jgi:hypothetical protein
LQADVIEICISMGNIVLENKHKKFLNWVYSSIMLNESKPYFLDTLTRVLKKGEYEDKDKKILNEIRKKFVSQYDDLIDDTDMNKKIQESELFNAKLTYISKLFEEIGYDKDEKVVLIDEVALLKTKKEVKEYYIAQVQLYRL